MQSSEILYNNYVPGQSPLSSFGFGEQQTQSQDVSNLTVDTNQLPSEPQVMRTKRMGHRKAASHSFGMNFNNDLVTPAYTPATTPKLENDTATAVAAAAAVAATISSGHLTSPTAVPQSSVDDFLLKTDMESNDFHLHPLKANPRNSHLGHRRFHSMGHPYAATNSSDSPPIYFNAFLPSHQKNHSGTSSMFDEFNVMNIQKDQELLQMEMQGMRPLRRLHSSQEFAPSPDYAHDSSSISVAQNSGDYNQHQNTPDFTFPQQQLYGDDIADQQESSNLAAIYQQQQQTIQLQKQTRQQNMMREKVFDDDSPFENEEYQQVITVCGWTTCNMEMHTQENLVSHILQDHVGNGKPSYTCEWAGCSRMCKPFTKRHKIQNHVRIHTGERPFGCPVDDCGKRFSRQDGLNTHIKTHSSVKPYVCSFAPCTKAYFHSRSLRKHERTHTDNGQVLFRNPENSGAPAQFNTQEYYPPMQTSTYSQQPGLNEGYIRDLTSITASMNAPEQFIWTGSE